MTTRSSSKPRRSQKTAEGEFVRDAVSSATGARFEVVPPHPAFPVSLENVEWFMRCREKEEIAKAPYLNTVWKERRVGIWLESLAVGDTVDWIELAYGEERAAASLDIDYSRFEEPAFRADLAKRFPVVMGRIGEYEKVAAAVGRRRKVHLELRHAGSKGMLVFSVAALVRSTSRSSRKSLDSALRRGVSALREAYDEVQRL